VKSGGDSVNYNFVSPYENFYVYYTFDRFITMEPSHNVVHDRHLECNVVCSDKKTREHSKFLLSLHPKNPVQYLTVDFQWVISSMFSIKN
jgi:hypothetical protein